MLHKQNLPFFLIFLGMVFPIANPFCAMEKSGPSHVKKQKIASSNNPDKPSAPPQETSQKMSPMEAKPFALSPFSQPLETAAKQALLIDVTTKTILGEKNATQRMVPSSLTKILTIYILLEAVKQKQISLSDTIVVSTHAARQEGSRMFLEPNKPVAYKDLLLGMIVTSGNDACTAFAESYGSELLFAEKIMNPKALELGATQSYFSNASGLPHPKHWSTCIDLARIAFRTLVDFPEDYAKYYGIKKYTFSKITQPNRNSLLFKGLADGMKTGMTEAGGYGIVASAQQNGRRLLLVLNGAPSSSVRHEEAVRLLNLGFNFFKSVLFFKEGEKVGEIRVGKEGKTMAMVAHKEISLCIPKNLLQKLKIKVKYMEPLLPPIKKGQKIGVLILSLPNWEQEYALVAESAFEDLSFFEKITAFLRW